MTEPRAWSLADRCEATGFEDWVAEARFEPAPLRAAPRSGRLSLDLERDEQTLASAPPSGLPRLLGGVRMPVWRWKLDLLGVREASLELDPDEVVFLVRDVEAGPTRLSIRGVSGRFEARGEDLAVRAEPGGAMDRESVRVLGLGWYRARTD